MKKKTSRIIAGVMLVVAVIFVLYAVNHPEYSFPWNNIITYIIYGVYAAVTAFLFVAPFKNDKT